MTSPSQLESACGNSFTTLLTLFQTEILLGWRKGTVIPLPPFSAPDSAPCNCRIDTFSICIPPPPHGSSCWCIKDERQIRGKEAKPPTSHPQHPDNISYCLPVCPLAVACLQSLLKGRRAKENVFNAVLLQHQPLACGWQFLRSQLLFCYGPDEARCCHQSSKTHKPTPSLAHKPHPVSWDRKQTFTEVTVVKMKAVYFCASSCRHFPIKIAKNNMHLSGKGLIQSNVFPN